ncbi:uncharacterized protein TNCV_3111021 [Trichonephila clavipes]|nr:uncharacterized protein TNCV_3111021 [Trichonephila clavipes]
MEPKSKAERLVLSFPATAENYPKAIDQLKERFGREDLLVQIYVRELLNLVMKNAVSGRTKTDLSALYDELEGNYGLWRALDEHKKNMEISLHHCPRGRNGAAGKIRFWNSYSKKDSPTESVKPTELTTASALVSSVKSSAKIIELIPGRDGGNSNSSAKNSTWNSNTPRATYLPFEVQAIANSDKELKEESVSVKSTKP